MKRSTMKIAMVMLILVGVGMMSYPWVSSMVNQLHSSEVISGYQKNVRDYSQEKKDAILKAAKQYNEKLLQSKVIMTDPFDEKAQRITSEEYEKTLSIDSSGMMAYLDIETINVHLPIYHGVSEEVLARAVGHLQGTSMPIGGKGSHSVLSAHTALAEARLFTDLDELEKKDIFQITVLDKKLTYEVYSIEVVKPEDISSLVIDPDKDLCTLVTCTPYGVNTHRLLVHGRRIPTPPEMEKETKQPVSVNIWFIGIIIAGILLILLLILWRKRKKKKRVKTLRKEVLGHE